MAENEIIPADNKIVMYYFLHFFDQIISSLW